MIEVKYNGKQPNLERGTLKIYVDDSIVYKKKDCCSLSIIVSFKDEEAIVSNGLLSWHKDEAKKFSKEIQNTVKKFLLKYKG